MVWLPQGTSTSNARTSLFYSRLFGCISQLRSRQRLSSDQIHIAPRSKPYGASSAAASSYRCSLRSHELCQVRPDTVNATSTLRAHCPNWQLIIRDQQHPWLRLRHPGYTTCSEGFSIRFVWACSVKSCIAPAFTIRDGGGARICLGLGDTGSPIGKVGAASSQGQHAVR